MLRHVSPWDRPVPPPPQWSHPQCLTWSPLPLPLLLPQRLSRPLRPPSWWCALSSSQLPVQLPLAAAAAAAAAQPRWLEVQWWWLLWQLWHWEATRERAKQLPPHPLLLLLSLSPPLLQRVGRLLQLTPPLPQVLN